MSPQPLSTKKDQAYSRWIVPQALAYRPQLAALVAQVIAIWSWIDAEYARLLAHFLKADHDVVLGMLSGIVSSEARRGAIIEAARTALSAQDRRLFEAVDKAINPSRKTRHAYAHGIWGYIEEWPDRLLWVHGKDFTANDFATAKEISGGRTLDSLVWPENIEAEEMPRRRPSHILSAPHPTVTPPRIGSGIQCMRASMTDLPAKMPPIYWCTQVCYCPNKGLLLTR